MADSTRGVWKAPANVSLNNFKKPAVKIDAMDQKDMNVTANGKLTIRDSLKVTNGHY